MNLTPRQVDVIVAIRNYRHLQSVLEKHGRYFRGIILPAAGVWMGRK